MDYWMFSHVNMRLNEVFHPNMRDPSCEMEKERKMIVLQND